MSQANPSRDDFAALLEESFSDGHSGEGQVVRGTITAIEKDMAIIDVGLKVEGRVPLKEFGAKAKDGQLKPGDVVEVYVERIENALGEAMLSREKARREESWVKLEEKFSKGERVEGVIFNQVKGGFTVDLDGAVAFLPRSQVDIRPVRRGCRRHAVRDLGHRLSSAFAADVHSRIHPRRGHVAHLDGLHHCGHRPAQTRSG